MASPSECHLDSDPSDLDSVNTEISDSEIQESNLIGDSLKAFTYSKYFSFIKPVLAHDATQSAHSKITMLVSQISLLLSQR